MTSNSSLLVVAGEGSGDAMAAAVVERLPTGGFGWGGNRLRAAGLEILQDVSHLGVMGLGAVLAKAPLLALATRRLLREVRVRRPRAALLVGFSELNSWFGPRLRRRGVRVLWYAPPQIWAWRPGRGRRLARGCDRLALVLPFEEELWRKLGADATYVGHPALEHLHVSRETARSTLGAAPGSALVALLPGSRTQEVRRHLPPMLAALLELRRRLADLDARVLAAPTLEPATGAWLAAAAASASVPVASEPAWRVLPAFDAALVASGTATLESAVAGVPPVIVYRTDPLSALIARRLLRVPSVGLPNLVLGRPAFPELLQQALVPEALAEALLQILKQPDHFGDCCRQLRSRLETAGAPGASACVADMLGPWLD